MKNAKVKICGLSEPLTIVAAINSGADYLGFVFYHKSPRNIDFKTAAKLRLIARGQSEDIKLVAVVVNPDDELIDNIRYSLNPDYIQLHGNESPQRVNELKQKGFRIIKAIGIKDANDVINAQQYYGLADYILFDAKPPKGATNAGGLGIKFDWSLLNDIPDNIKWFLSGGLDIYNVKEAIAATNAEMIDVSSGVEKSLGIKDISKIQYFISAAKGN